VSNDDADDADGWNGAVEPPRVGHAVVVVGAAGALVAVLATLVDGVAVVTVTATDVDVDVVGAGWLAPLVHAAKNIAPARPDQTVRQTTVRSWHLGAVATGTGTIHATSTCAAALLAARRRRR